MKYRKLDLNGDYTFGSNLQDYVEGIEAISQAIKTKILLFYGEWWENIGIGIPMFQSLVGHMNPENLKMSSTMLLTERIKEVEGVVSVSDVNMFVVGRTINFSAHVNTTFGETVVEVET